MMNVDDGSEFDESEYEDGKGVDEGVKKRGRQQKRSEERSEKKSEEKEEGVKKGERAFDTRMNEILKDTSLTPKERFVKIFDDWNGSTNLSYVKKSKYSRMKQVRVIHTYSYTYTYTHAHTHRFNSIKPQR